MNEIIASQVSIQDPFWGSRLLTNAKVAIFHQWRQLEESRCIDNFRLVTGDKEGFREGWFFADSDAYKWLDAAARIYASWPSTDLKELTDKFIDLLGRAQLDDGYLYTYNQIHFPGERWGNLMIEHELYCHGHLIEAGVSHFEATGQDTAFIIARKAADLLVTDFLHATTDMTSGHEEIEIALLKLHQITGSETYLELARVFIERRGRVQPFAHLIIQQNARVAQRSKFVREQKMAYLENHPDQIAFKLPADNFAKKPRSAKLRRAIAALTGQYFQQHALIRKQTVPVGHSVRFAYLETAVAMLYRRTGDDTLLPALKKAWNRMVSRRMYITGGIGSLPEMEGFGRDYELDPEVAYTETCAGLGSLFWNWEMVLATGDACYSDLFEWQLYNAAAVGMGLGGDTYLYNNPLLCRGGVKRLAWYLVPCCPSNISRTWASLGKYIYSYNKENLWVHQYIGSQTSIENGTWKLEMDSGLPWTGKVRLSISAAAPSDITVHLRIPSWAGKVAVKINGEPFLWQSPTQGIDHIYEIAQAKVAGYNPYIAEFLPIKRVWSADDVIELGFELPIYLRTASTKIRGHKGKITLSRGPIVYCLESIDNPNIDILRSMIDTNSIRTEYAPALLGGTQVLTGKTKEGNNFTAIPYFLWANRGESQMVVWMKT